jgi:hypothetical protein
LPWRRSCIVYTTHNNKRTATRNQLPSVSRWPVFVCFFLADVAMTTALQSSAAAAGLSMHNDDDPLSSDDFFEFESDYVKSLLRQHQHRIPASPLTQKPPSAARYPHADKENIERAKTPQTAGTALARTVLGHRDLNSASTSLSRSASVIGVPGETSGHATPALKLSSSYPRLPDSHANSLDNRLPSPQGIRGEDD